VACAEEFVFSPDAFGISGDELPVTDISGSVENRNNSVMRRINVL